MLFEPVSAQLSGGDDRVTPWKSRQFITVPRDTDKRQSTHPWITEFPISTDVLIFGLYKETTENPCRYRKNTGRNLHPQPTCHHCANECSLAWNNPSLITEGIISASFSRITTGYLYWIHNWWKFTLKMMHLQRRVATTRRFTYLIIQE